jgi:hypothetical protein
MNEMIQKAIDHGTSLDLSFADPKVKAIIQRCYPGAKTRRTVKLSFRNSYKVHDYWDGGSRDYVMFLKLETMEVLSSEDLPKEQRQVASNPYNLPIAEIKIPPGILVVIHSKVSGKDMGYRIIASKDEAFEDSAMKEMEGSISSAAFATHLMGLKLPPKAL